MAERRVTTPAGGLRISAVLLTLKTNGGAMFGFDELEDALWVYSRDPQTRTTSVNSEATLDFIVLCSKPDGLRICIAENARSF